MISRIIMILMIRILLLIIITFIGVISIFGCSSSEHKTTNKADSSIPAANNTTIPSPSITTQPYPTTHTFLYSDLEALGIINSNALLNLRIISEASGIELPWPHYLPEGYLIDQVNGERSSVVFTISEGKNIHIRLGIRWNPKSYPPYKIHLNRPTVEFNGRLGQLFEEQSENGIIWNWYPENNARSFVLSLSASNLLPISELVKIASSIDF